MRSGLACLTLIARLVGMPIDVDRLAAQGAFGQHGADGRAGADEPDMAALATCAAAAGFRAKALRLDWRHLQDLGRALPAIVTFRDGRRFVMSRIAGAGEVPDVTLIDPADADRPIVMLRAAFELAWTGDTVLLKRVAVPVAAEQPFGWGTLFALARQNGHVVRDLALATATLAVLAVSPVVCARALVGDVLVADARGTLVFVLCGLAVLIAFEVAFAASRGRLVARLAETCTQRLDAMVLARMLRLGATDLDVAPPGILARRLGRTEALGAFLAGPLAQGLLEAGAALALLPVMVWLSAPLTVLVLLLTTAAVGLVLLLSGAQRRAETALALCADEAAAALTETTIHRPTVQALGLEGRQRRRWDVLVARATRGRRTRAAASGRLDAVAVAAEGAIFTVPLVLGIALSLGAARPLASADLFAFLLAAWRFAAPLRHLGGDVRLWGAARDAIVTLRALMDTAADPRRSAQAGTLRFTGQVSFTEVCFTYPGAATPTLDAVSFAVEAGTLVGLVGRSGAGTSTLSRLLGRHLGAFEGLIKVDGIDIRAIPLDQLRRAIAVVSDDTAWFAGTLRDNMTTTHPDATDAEITAALRLAGAASVVDALPGGLDAVVVEGAIACSDGERQRLAIARALLGRPVLLFLDEATSALDAEAEARLLANLKNRDGLTVVVVTQRPASLALADAVLVLGDAAIRDTGQRRDAVGRSDRDGDPSRHPAPALRHSPAAEALPPPSARAA